MSADPHDCDCCDFTGDVSIKVTAGPATPACCHSCPPEAFIVSYDDGTSRVMTDEDREAFIKSLATPWN